MKKKILYVNMAFVRHAVSYTTSVMKAFSKVGTPKSFPYRRIARRHGAARMNEILVETALEFQPDLVFIRKGERISGSAIKRIKENTGACVILHYEDYRTSPQQWVLDIGKYADLILFENDDENYLNAYRARGLERIGPRWCNGVDPEVFYPRDVEKTWDLVFMGQNISLPHEGYKVRRQLLETALRRGFSLHIFGGARGWKYLGPRAHLHKFVIGGKFAEACSRAKITLGTHGVYDVHLYASWRRIFESSASGAFHLTHYVSGLETVFENHKHLVWFNSVPEAMDLIDYYLTHTKEREEIAAAGRQEVLAHHTWDNRISALVEILEDTQVKESNDV